MKIVTLEDEIVPSVPSLPALGGATSNQVIDADNPAEAPPAPTQPRTRILAMVPMNQSGNCACGSCSQCHSRSQWGGAMPEINIEVNPTITANGGSSSQGDQTTSNSQGDQSNSNSQGDQNSSQGDVGAYSEGAYSEGADASATGGHAVNEGSYPSTLPQQPAPAQPMMSEPTVVEKPVFIDRVHEVVNEVVKPVYIPVKEVVETIKREPMFMPFKTVKPVDRNVAMPVKYDVPQDRDVAMPVKYDVPQERVVAVPVRETQTRPAERPPQPFQTVTNKKDTQTGVNYFS